MKILALTAAGLLFATAPVLARDVPLSNREIANVVSGKQFAIGGGVASFGADRTYNFSGLFSGKWRATNRSICITFSTGESRCDKVVRNGKQIFLIDGVGNRTHLK